MECVLTLGSQPIYNPPIPFCSRLDGGLRMGMCVFVQGKVPHHAERFHVNFRCGQNDDSDIALHFNPRFGWFEKVIFNSLEGGSWCHEEKKHELPFRKGEHFEVVFIVKQDSYQVNVNGGSFYEFNHRIPLERVEFIQVAGDVTIESIKFGLEAGGFGSGMVITSGRPIAYDPKPETPSHYPGSSTLETLKGKSPTISVGTNVGEETVRQEFQSGGRGDGDLDERTAEGEAEEGEDVWSEDWWCPQEVAGERPQLRGVAAEPGMMPDPSYNPGVVPGGMGMPGYQPGNMPGMMPGNQYNPAGMPGGMNMPGYQLGYFPGQMPAPSYNPAGMPGGMVMPGYESGTVIPIPYCGNIFGGLAPEKTIVIRGLIPNGASRLNINFLVGFSREIAMHMSLRMAERRVVRNAFLNGSWGEEEVELSYNPFAHGERFDIVVRCGNSCFHIYVNGQHLFNFDHRFGNFQQIDAIEIDGDVVLSAVQL